KASNQFIAINAVGKTRVILDDGGGRQQSARVFASQDQRFQIGARGVQGGGPSRATRTDDDNFFHRAAKVSFSREGWQGRFVQRSEFKVQSSRFKVRSLRGRSAETLNLEP